MRISRPSRQHLPLIATITVFIALYAAASLRYEGFLAPGVLVNLFGDNSFLGITAVGATFVILSGGIDLSVGAIIALTSIVVAVLVEKLKVHPVVAVAVVLALGTTLGTGMGLLVHFFRMPPFLVTLAGMFLARGLAYVVSMESISISHPLYIHLSSVRVPLGGEVTVPLTAIAFLVVLLIALYIAHQRPFGRTVYAIGGNEEAAVLMGLPVARTKVLVYAQSGFCSALAGLVYTIYTSSGNANAVMGHELDTIAAVVMGGTLLSGGVGYMFGTLIGVLIFGLIQTIISFEGTLSSWWTSIAIGLLLLGFILLQKLLSRGATRTT